MTGREEFERLLRELQEVAGAPDQRRSSSFAALYESPAYRSIQAMGLAAVPGCLAAIAGGALFLNRAVLRICALSAQDLTGKRFPSEQEIARALFQWVDLGARYLEWSCESAPSSPRVESGRATAVFERARHLQPGEWSGREEAA